MELVICGEPSYEQAKASYLTMFRPPFLVQPQLVNTYYISDL